MKMSMALNYKNTLRSGGLWAFSGKLSTSFMTLLINAILARMLVTEDIGIYFLAFNIAIFGAYIGTIGFEQTVVRYVAESIGKNEPKNILYIIKLSMFATTIGTAVVGMLYFYSSDWIALTVFHSTGLTEITTLIILWIGANGFQILIGEAFRGFQDIRFASIFGGLLSTAVFITVLAIVYYFKWIPLTLHSTLFLWIMALFFSNTVGIVVLIRKVKIVMRGAMPAQKRTVNLLEILPTTFSFMVIAISFYFISQSDLWIISVIGSDKDVAIYGAAAKLALLLSMPLIILNSVVAPIIAEKHAQGRMKEFEITLRAIATLAFVPTLALFLLFIFFGKTILTIIFGSAIYGSGALILSLLALKHLIGVWSGATTTLLAMAGKQKKLMEITLWTGLASILLSIVTGPLYDGVGVALSFLIPSIFSQVYIIITAFKLLNIRADVDLYGTFIYVKSEIGKTKLRKKLASKT